MLRGKTILPFFSKLFDPHQRSHAICCSYFCLKKHLGELRLKKPLGGFHVRNFWLHRKVHPVLWRFPGDMLNLTGDTPLFFCGREFFFGPKRWCFFFKSELGQILTKKCYPKQMRFFSQFCLFSTKPHHRQDFCSKKDEILLKFYKFHFFNKITTFFNLLEWCIWASFRCFSVRSTQSFASVTGVKSSANRCLAWGPVFKPNDHSKIVANL